MEDNSDLVVGDSVKLKEGATTTQYNNTRRNNNAGISAASKVLYSTILDKYGLAADAVGIITDIDTAINPPLANVKFGRDTVKIYITALKKVAAGGSRRRQRKSRRARKSSRKSMSRSRR